MRRGRWPVVFAVALIVVLGALPGLAQRAELTIDPPPEIPFGERWLFDVHGGGAVPDTLKLLRWKPDDDDWFELRLVTATGEMITRRGP